MSSMWKVFNPNNAGRNNHFVVRMSGREEEIKAMTDTPLAQQVDAVVRIPVLASYGLVIFSGFIN
jgi:hypothetical protein